MIEAGILALTCAIGIPIMRVSLGHPWPFETGILAHGV